MLRSGSKGIALWNLGGSDIALGMRVKSLDEAANLIFTLQSEGIQIEITDSTCRMFVYSTSSHCAIALSPNSCSVSTEALRKWIEGDTLVRFHMLFETSYGHNGLLVEAKNTHMVLGERDYEFPFPADRNEWPEFLCKYLNESASVNKVFHHRTTYVVPEIAIKEVIDSIPPNVSNILVWENSDDRLFSTLEDIVQIVKTAEFTYGQMCDKNSEQLIHCRNSLLGLIKYAFRLQATMGQYDLFCYIKRVYCSLNIIALTYKDRLVNIAAKQNRNSEDEDEFRQKVAELTQNIFVVVSELQHLFSILSISPHTYMETYGSSMRSLNAATKLWDAYNGIILTLNDLFPSISGEHRINKTIMISPYRERQSENTQLFPSSADGEESFVLIQMNFSLLFRTRLAVYMLIHECGHHLAEGCRKERFRCMSLSFIHDLCEHIWGFAVQAPIYLIVTMAESETNCNISCAEYRSLAKKEKKTPEDYRKLLMVSIDQASDSICSELYSRLSSVLGQMMEKQISVCIEKIYTGFEAWYLSSEDQSWQHQHYYANKVAYAYSQFPDELVYSLMENMYTSIFKKASEGLAWIIKECESRGCKIDPYQQAKLQAFWQFEQSKELIESKVKSLISVQDKNTLAHDAIELFREIYADMFAVTVLGMSKEHYLDLLNEFSDITPPLICGLIRVCFQKHKVERKLKEYAIYGNTKKENRDECRI